MAVGIGETKKMTKNFKKLEKKRCKKLLKFVIKVVTNPWPTNNFQ